MITTVTGEQELVGLKFELGKTYYIIGVLYSRRHEGSVMKNHLDSMDNLKIALSMLPENSPEWLQTNSMMAKMHSGVDAPDAALAGEDFGETTDNLDTSLKHLQKSAEQVDPATQKSEWGELQVMQASERCMQFPTRTAGEERLAQSALQNLSQTVTAATASDSAATAFATAASPNHALTPASLVQWQLGYMMHLKLRQLKGGDGSGAISEVAKEMANKVVEKCIDHLSNALTVILPSTAPAPDRFCAIHSVMAATHTIRADVLTLGNASTMDVLEAQATLAEAVGHYMAACEQWQPESYPEQFSLVRSRIGETFVKMGELGKAAHAYRGAMLAAGMLCNVTSYEKAVFVDKEILTKYTKKPWQVWSRVAGVFEACAEICVCRALMEGGEQRSTIPKNDSNQKEKWIWILDPEELAEIAERKRLEAEKAAKLIHDHEKAHPIRSGAKKSAGLADWETADDQYDAEEDMGGKFDVGSAMKERDAKNRAKLMHGDKATLSHLIGQERKVIEADLLGKDSNDGTQVGRNVVSGWKSYIPSNPFPTATTGKAKIAPPSPAPKTPPPKTNKDHGPSTSAQDTLRKKQKANALKASGFKAKRPGSVPDAPSHIKAPSMPPPASALMTAAGAIVPLAPKGIMAPKGPPPKASKSTVEERFIRAVWNLEDAAPTAPSHIRAPGSIRELGAWDKIKKRVVDTKDYVKIKYEIVASIGKMYHYDAKVLAHPRTLEALHICCRAATVKFVEGCKAAEADSGRRAIEDMEIDLFYKTSRKYVGHKSRLTTQIFTVKKLEDEVKKQKHEFGTVERGIQWLSNKSLDLNKCVLEVKRLEELIRKDVSKDNGFLSLLSTVPCTVMTPKQEQDHAHRRLGLPHNSVYPTERDLLKTVSLYEAKVIWYMAEEHGIARDTSEEGFSISGDGKVGSQALFCAVIYRDLIRFTPLGKKISKERSALMDRVEAKTYAEELEKDELEMRKIREMKLRDAKKAMKRRRKRIMKRESLKQKGSGYVRVPGDVKVKLLCCEAVDCKKSVEVAVAAYVDAARTKQYHKRAFLLEKALKFLGDSLGIHRLVGSLPNHVDSLCLIPQGVMRLAPLHALPIPSASGSKLYRGETLSDRFTIRYSTSLAMSDFCDMQAEWAKECTPWHYRKCCVLADPVKNHPASKPTMRLGEMEGRVVRSVWSSDDDDTSLLLGKEAHCNVGLVSEKLINDGEAQGFMKDEANKLMDLRKGGGRKKGKKGKAQVMISEGVWQDMEGSSSDDSDDSSDDGGGDGEKRKGSEKGGDSEDEEDENTDHDHVLSVCRVLHIVAPVEHQPEPGILLAPPPIGDSAKKSKDLFVSNGAAHVTAKAILKQLHMKHCGLVFLSRGALAASVNVGSDVSNLKSKRSIGIDIGETFILAGAQTVVMPLWADESTALSTVLFTIKFYDELVDCADESRPVAVAVRHTQSWMKNANFSNIRSVMWASRVHQNLLEELGKRDHTHTHTHTHTHAHAHTHIYMCVCVCVLSHIYIYVCVCVCVCAILALFETTNKPFRRGAVGHRARPEDAQGGGGHGRGG